MKQLMFRFRGLAIALVVLALSAGLAFGAQPDASAWGLANASSHAGKTVPVKAGDADESTDEDVDEDADEDADEEVAEEEPAEEEEASEDSEHCATDPTTLTEDELAEMNHGSIVCWAAHQTEWPEEFANHGAWVRSWAHKDKSDDESDEDAASGDDGSDDGALTEQSSTGKGKGNGKGKNK